jgi:hypothetical protein
VLIARRLLFIPVLVVAFACVSVRSGFSLAAEDNGTTKNVTVGSELRLVLPADLDWTLESTNTTALALKSSQVGNVGTSSMRIWLFDVKQAGDYVVRATGDAQCRKNVPPCATPTVRYEFNIRAR